MKLLVIPASLDLTQPFSATPAWWQLLKAFYEEGVEIIASPYQGPAIESLWWRALPNPAKRQGDMFKAVRHAYRRVASSKSSPPTEAISDEESVTDRVVRQAARRTVAPLWLRHIDRALTKEPDIDAVLFLTTPLNHLVGVPAEIQRRHKKPVFYYDGDVPASLPSMKGFASGFRIYQGSKPDEYTAFISNSKGGEAKLLELGAKAAHTVWYGVDPDVFAPVNVPSQDVDVFFYGHGREYRADWVDSMLGEPSQQLDDARFAVRGTRLGVPDAVESLPYLSFSKLREYACRSKINLCITRAAHAGTFASSSSRPFELSAMGCCIVANPYLGIEEWFEPGKELFVVESSEEAIDRYRYLLSHDAERQAVGLAARERALKQHTFRHRARELMGIIAGYL